MLTDHNFVALRPEWVPLHDENQIVLYLLSTRELRYHILTPEQAVVVPFLDGRRTAAEVATMIGYIFSLTSLQEGRALLERTIEELNADREKIAILDRPASWSINYNPLDFIIPRDKYVPARRLGRPIALLLYFSARCQTNCVYCYADLDNMRRLKHLPLGEWERILDEACALGIRLVELTGGDTLGRPNSIAFVEKLVEREFLFLLSTKCHISPDNARRLADAGFGQPVNGVKRDIQISVDSPEPAVADYLAGRQGQLERATHTIRNLIAVGLEPIVKSVVTPLNISHVRRQVEYFAPLGVRHFRFSTYGRSYYRHDDALFTSDEMKAEAAGLLDGISCDRPDLEIEADFKNSSQHSQADPDLRKERWASRAGCSAGRTMLGVAPDGRAVLCEQMPLTAPYFVGDLTRQSILDVWKSPQLLDFIYPPRERFAGTPCHDCAEFDYCIYDLGHCFRESFFAFGQLYTPPPKCPSVPADAYRSI